MHRHKQDRIRKASMRELETCEETLHRHKQDRICKASMRELEACEETLHRKHNNKVTMANKRKSYVSVDHSILSFHCDIKNGPDFVCTCCHRMMYRQSVIICNLHKYTKCGIDLLNRVFSSNHSYISNDGNEWVCMTCDRALKRGVMPLQAEANGVAIM